MTQDWFSSQTFTLLVFAGMCERINPVVEALRDRVRSEEIVSLEFCRTSLTGDVADVGIHKLDLF